MMRMSAAALLASLALAGCAASPPPVPETPKEAWFTTVAAYDGALALASEYRRDCSRRPPLRQSRCMETVVELRRLNREALGWKELGDMALAEDDDEFLGHAADQLDDLRERMEEEVAEDGADAGTEPAP
jgi:hypothetical protein